MYGENMRIISGIHKGRRIERVGIKTTRETADMVKEAVFQMLPSQDNAIVLDLFAGSGAYAFEALSRGAKHAYLSDYNKKAIFTIRKNANTLNVEDKVDILFRSYDKMLKKVKDVQFDTIFIDPPYAFKHYKELLIDLSLITKIYGLVVVETEKKTHLDDIYNDLIKIKEKTYGIKRIHIYKKNAKEI